MTWERGERSKPGRLPWRLWMFARSAWRELAFSALHSPSEKRARTRHGMETIRAGDVGGAGFGSFAISGFRVELRSWYRSSKAFGRCTCPRAQEDQPTELTAER